MKICDNCETKIGKTVGDADGGGAFKVGREQGGQRDSYYNKIDLCGQCVELLERGDFAGLRDRWARVNPSHTAS